MSGNDKKDDPKGGAASSAAPPPAPSAVEAIEEDDEFEEFEPCQWSGQDEDAEDSQQWQVRGGSGSPGPCSPAAGEMTGHVGGDCRTRGRALVSMPGRSGLQPRPRGPGRGDEGRRDPRVTPPRVPCYHRSVPPPVSRGRADCGTGSVPDEVRWSCDYPCMKHLNYLLSRLSPLI